MFQFDPTTGSMVLPIWVSATVAAIVVVLAVLALARSGAVKTVSIVLAAAVLLYAGWAGSVLLDRVGANDRLDERRAFEQRTSELVGRSFVPGSPLSCLETAGGEQVDNACEKVLFSSPENISAAVSYTTARMVLLADGLDLAGRSDLNYDAALSTLRRGLETDRYGIVAHVLLQRENCTADQCEALSLLNDPNRVRANLQDKPFEALVARYSATWPAPGHAGAPVAEAPKTGPAGPVAGGTPVSSKFDFPSAASIPPVSIMNAEPSTPSSAAPPTTGTTPPSAAAGAPSSAAGASAAAPTPPVPPRRPPAARAPVARTPAPAAATAAAPSPVPLAPAPGATQGQQTQ